MSLISRSPAPSILPLPNTEAAYHVAETSNAIELDRREVILTGSAALALYGLHRIPKDIDLHTTILYRNELRDNAPRGMWHKSTERRSDGVVDTYNSAGLPIDIIANEPWFLSPDHADDKLRRRIERHGICVDGIPIRVVALDSLMKHLKRTPTEKAQADLRDIRANRR